MAVLKSGVTMPVAMRFPWRMLRTVVMQMVSVVSMDMLMFEHFMIVHMLVTFRDMQPEPNAHEYTGEDQPLCNFLI